jgi:hypothetical protein
MSLPAVHSALYQSPSCMSSQYLCDRQSVSRRAVESSQRTAFHFASMAATLSLVILPTQASWARALRVGMLLGRELGLGRLVAARALGCRELSEELVGARVAAESRCTSCRRVMLSGGTAHSM